MGSIRRNLAEYLLRCNYYEMMGERVREKIAQNPYFQIETVFERMDKFKKGYLVPDDFSEFMLDNQLYPTDIELYLVFRDFDQERVGVVTLQQLAIQLLPKEQPSIYKKAVSRKRYAGGLRLEIDLEYIIAKYFEHKLKEIKQLSMLRVEMFRKQAYTVEEAFSYLDCQKKSYLSQLNEIDQFLRHNGKLVTKDELARIFRVLSFDKGDQIPFEMFAEHLDPLGRGYYIGYSQRMAQKHQVQQNYLRQQLELKSQQVNNSREQVLLSSSISELQRSNGYLSSMIEQQALERRLNEEQLLGYRVRRGL